MAEKVVAQARAQVMIYNNDMRKWEHAGGSPGLSRVHICYNPKSELYRIVGRKITDGEVVINCILVRNLKYNKATATFHQWRDQRHVFGLNFQSPEDANVFSEGFLGALEIMNKPIEPLQPPTHFNGADSYHDNHQLSRQYQEDQSSHMERRPPPIVRIESRVSAPTEPPKTPITTPTRPSVPPSSPTPPKVTLIPPHPAKPPSPAPPPASPVPPSIPARPPASPLPPSTPAANIPQPPPPPSSGVGPPPAPPPPPSGVGPPPAPTPPPSGGGLASALQGVRLKKTSEPAEEKRSPIASNPMEDMMSALNKKLLARKKMAESSSGMDESEKPQVPSVNEESCFVFQSQQSTNKTPTTLFSNRNSNNKSNNVPPPPSPKLSRSKSFTPSDDSKSLKEEIIQIIKAEVRAAKLEIIEAMRQELRQSATS